MKERTVEQYLDRQVRAAGGMTVKVAPTEKGVPDRLVLLAGHCILVEVKAPQGRLSAAQQLWHERAALRAGVTVQVVWSKAEVDHLLARLLTS